MNQKEPYCWRTLTRSHVVIMCRKKKENNQTKDQSKKPKHNKQNQNQQNTQRRLQLRLQKSNQFQVQKTIPKTSLLYLLVAHYSSTESSLAWSSSPTKRKPHLISSPSWVSTTPASSIIFWKRKSLFAASSSSDVSLRHFWICCSLNFTVQFPICRLWKCPCSQHLRHWEVVTCVAWTRK